MRFLTSVKGLAAVAVLAAGAYAIPSATAAETMGPVTDEIGVVKIAKGRLLGAFGPGHGARAR